MRRMVGRMVRRPLLSRRPTDHEHDHDDDTDDDECDKHDAKYLERSAYQPLLAKTSILADVDERCVERRSDAANDIMNPSACS